MQGIQRLGGRAWPWTILAWIARAQCRATFLPQFCSGICILICICIWCPYMIAAFWKCCKKWVCICIFIWIWIYTCIRTFYGLADCPYFGRWENPGERWVSLVKKYSGHSRKILAKGRSVCFQLVHNEYKVCLQGKSGSAFHIRPKVCRHLGGYSGIFVFCNNPGESWVCLTSTCPQWMQDLQLLVAFEIFIGRVIIEIS